MHAALRMTLLMAATAGAIQHAHADEGTAHKGEHVMPLCSCGDPMCDGNLCKKAWNRDKQSGYGLCVAPWATLTYGPKYKSYYVGGSVRPQARDPRVRPEPRYPWEGTWGRDYVPRFTSSVLWWSHGSLYQDDGGQYEPDRRNVPFFLRFGK